MKDDSKAKWPEGMKYEAQATNPGWTSIYLWDEEHSYQGDVIGDTKEEAESRARQICALPKMVALLKEIAYNGGHNIPSDSDPQEVKDAQSILREIGEVE